MREPVEGSTQAYDVSQPPPRSDDEHAVAVLLRGALDDPHLADDQVDRWIGAAVHRSAARRRRRRLVGSAVLTACSAAVVAAVVAVPLGSSGPNPNPPRQHQPPDGGAMARPQGIAPSAGPNEVPLTTAEVATVVPGAEPWVMNGPNRPNPPMSAPGNACGTGELPGVAVPVRAAYTQWGVRAEAGAQRVLFATANTWARAEDATGYAAALQASLSDCDASTRADQHVVPRSSAADDGTAFTTAYSDGAWDVTALAVQGTSSVLLTGWVPGPHTDSGARAAGRALTQLAVTAVGREAGR